MAGASVESTIVSEDKTTYIYTFLIYYSTAKSF